jgi:hypothetical protein
MYQEDADRLAAQMRAQQNIAVATQLRNQQLLSDIKASAPKKRNVLASLGPITATGRKYL